MQGPERKARLQPVVALMGGCAAPEAAPGPEADAASLRPFLVEECYEVVTRSRRRTGQGARGTGDLLFQIVFHARIARRKAGSTWLMSSTASTRRWSPASHVFGSASAATDTEVLANWEEIKKREKGGDDGVRSGRRAPEPPLPAPRHRLQEKAARVGFDWSH